jgi:hypothetical protein
MRLPDMAFSHHESFKFDKGFLLTLFFLQPDVPACSCVDCEASCPSPPPEPEPPKPFTILGLDGVAVVMGIIWAVGSLVFLTVVLCCCNNTIGNVQFSWSDLKLFFQQCCSVLGMKLLSYL